MIRVVFNQKGGVGKSTIVCNLAAINADSGRSSLVIDMDPQGNSSQYLLGPDWDQRETNVARYLEGTLGRGRRNVDPAEYCVETPYPDLWVMPGSPDLAELRIKLEQKHKIYKLRDAIGVLAKEVDDIYIDTPPAYDFFSLSSLIAADRCLIPFDCDEFSRKALYTLMENIEEVQLDHNEDLKLEGIVVNQFQAQSNLPARIVAEMKKEKLPILDPMISSSVVVKESHEASQPLVYFKRSHKVTQQFIELHKKLKRRRV
ncbi:MAG: ParA family protein [Pseudomonadota bacterium]